MVRAGLERRVAAVTATQQDVLRATVVLMGADGAPAGVIAAKLSMAASTVSK